MNLRAILVVAGLGAAFAPARHASAQTFPVRDAVLERIWSIGMDSETGKASGEARHASS